MAPTLIVLALLALGVGIVAFATRPPPGLAAPLVDEADTGWRNPAPAVEPDPFAHAPDVSSETPSPTSPAAEPPK